MSSITSRYQPHPDLLLWELRSFFIYFLVREPAYQDLTERLRSLWRNVLDRHQTLDSEIAFDQLPDNLPADDPLNVYVAALHVGVSDRLRCREGGAPAAWVCYAVHGGVTGASVGARATPQAERLLGTLQVVVDFGSAVVLAKVDGAPLSTPEEVDRAAIEPSYSGSRFDQWKRLRQKSHDELDRLLDAMQEQIDGATSEWPRLNQQGRKTRTQVTMPKLVRWVVGDEEQFDGDRSATNVLLHDVRLDPPGQSKKNR